MATQKHWVKRKTEHSQNAYCNSESIEWFTENHAFSPSYDLAQRPTPPAPPPPAPNIIPVSKLILIPSIPVIGLAY
jgi:hypothetical protein